MKPHAALRAPAILIGLATFATLALAPAEAQAACRGGFCVSGRDNGDVHIVDFTTSLTKVTHFNWSSPQGQQHELGPNETQFSFNNLPSGTLEQFGMQACSGGGFMQKSRCTSWTYFTHTVP